MRYNGPTMAGALTAKREALIPVLAQLPAPSIAQAAKTVGMSRQAASTARQDKTVREAINSARLAGLDRSKDMVRALEDATRKACRALGGLALSADDPVLLIAATEKLIDAWGKAHALAEKLPDPTTPADRIEAYSSSIRRGVRIGRYLAQRAAREGRADHAGLQDGMVENEATVSYCPPMT